jgi:hypothetical protein
MAHGLIPIIPRESNIDVGDWGVLLPSSDVSSVRAAIRAAAAASAAQCRVKAAGVVAETGARYSAEHYRSSFRDAVLEILGRHANRSSVSEAESARH